MFDHSFFYSVNTQTEFLYIYVLFFCHQLLPIMLIKMCPNIGWQHTVTELFVLRNTVKNGCIVLRCFLQGRSWKFGSPRPFSKCFKNLGALNFFFYKFGDLFIYKNFQKFWRLDANVSLGLVQDRSCVFVSSICCIFIFIV